MLSLNEIKTGKIILVNHQPYLVMKTDHHKVGRGHAVLKAKLRNLIDDNILEKTFQGNEKAEEAITGVKKANYLYKDEASAHFMEAESYEQFSLSLEQLGEKIKFLKDNTEVDILYFQDKPVAVDLPVKVELKVVIAPPGVKGNSAGNVTKVVELETGAQIAVPMFINQGDIIRINTETGEYVERA